ncbi:hypothetical protein [Microbacterium sp. 179-I 3D4 NHS]|uniref:hypothetical protein n=1 Tax=Microbacterium sp. 179-I 3D4 NHS TaxID=3142381 RepID=UPI0039A29DB9
MSSDDHGDFYRGPDDAVLDDGEFTKADFGGLSDNHNLITQDVADNDEVLEDLRGMVTP